MSRVDCSIDEYHEHQALSHSKLRTFSHKGPRAYYLRHVQHTAKLEPSKDMVLGRAFEDFLNRELGHVHDYDEYAVQVGDGRTKEGKAWLAAMRSAGKLVIKAEDEQNFERMAASIEALPGVYDMLNQADSQASYRVACDGLPGLQSRPDWSLPENGFVGRAHVDLKTTLDLDTFGQSITRYGYHTQAAMVALTTQCDEYYLLVAEKAFPHRAQLQKLSHAFIEIGKLWVQDQIGQLRDHYANNEWPRVRDSQITIEPPQWLVNKYAERGALAWTG